MALTKTSEGIETTVVLWHERYGYIVLRELWVHEDGTQYGVFEVDYMGLCVSLPLHEVEIDYI